MVKKLNLKLILILVSILVVVTIILINVKMEKNVCWEKTYGGSDFDSAYSIQQTKDGGYIVAGYTKSKGAGEYDFWVLKLNEKGKIIWEKTYVGSGYDGAYSIQQTRDDGYIVAGVTSSKGAGGSDFWILKLNEKGEIEK
jgi:ABC-type cobalt transport system substrate-binding protein